ncbi:MAG: hypothetical protein RXR52_39785 [Paraburkholderia sp.]|uniref:hypothetical protein n=1 Tax=Paraburkholderia sp. TaxID=1926495 RepID=UPI00397E7868
MDKITRIGVDLAKNISQVHGVDSMERVVVRKAISRQKFLEWFANRESCLVAMGACSAAHYWGRALGGNERPSTNRPALAVDRSAPGTRGLVSNAGGRRQQARAHPVGDSCHGERFDPSYVSTLQHRASHGTPAV